MPIPALMLAGAAIGAGSALARGPGSSDDKYALEREGIRGYNRQFEALYGSIDPSTGQPWHVGGSGWIDAPRRGYASQIEGLARSAERHGQNQIDSFGASKNYLRGLYDTQGRNISAMTQRFRDEVVGGIGSAGKVALGNARQATGDVVGTYKNYGREAEGTAREAYSRELQDISDAQAARRTRGGYNSADAMVAAGQRGEAQYGFSRGMSDIAQRRAELVGGAMERGRSQELGIGQGYDMARYGALQDIDQQRLGIEAQRNADRRMQEMAMAGQEIDLRNAAFAVPAAYREGLYNAEYGAATSPVGLYPKYNLRLASGYEQPFQQSGTQGALDFLEYSGGKLMGHGVTGDPGGGGGGSTASPSTAAYGMARSRGYR